MLYIYIYVSRLSSRHTAKAKRRRVTKKTQLLYRGGVTQGPGACSPPQTPGWQPHEDLSWERSIGLNSARPCTLLARRFIGSASLRYMRQPSRPICESVSTLLHAPSALRYGRHYNPVTPYLGVRATRIARCRTCRTVYSSAVSRMHSLACIAIRAMLRVSSMPEWSLWWLDGLDAPTNQRLGRRPREAPKLHCGVQAAVTLLRGPEDHRAQARGRLEPWVTSPTRCYQDDAFRHAEVAFPRAACPAARACVRSYTCHAQQRARVCEQLIERVRSRGRPVWVPRVVVRRECMHAGWLRLEVAPLDFVKVGV